MRISVNQADDGGLIDEFYIDLGTGEKAVETLPGERNISIIEVEYQVTCTPDWTGDYCEIGRVCSVNCSNGVCSASNDSCVCQSGFTGERCDQPDHCHTADCNGAKCENHGEAFTCVCPEGYVGEFCESKDNCAGEDCGSGQCVDRGDSFECRCDPGYTGQYCQLSINRSCENVNCSGRGQCVGVEESYECVCNSGYSGKTCEFEGLLVNSLCPLSSKKQTTEI